MDDLWVDDVSRKLGCRDDERLFVKLFARSIMIGYWKRRRKQAGHGIFIGRTPLASMTA